MGLLGNYGNLNSSKSYIQFYPIDISTILYMLMCKVILPIVIAKFNRNITIFSALLSGN